MRIAITLSLTGALAAQPPPDLEALASMVETAHRPAGPVPEVTAFRSDLELHLLDADADQAGQVGLAVMFLLAPRAGQTRSRPWIRYEVRDAKTPIVRGRDEFGPWQLVQGEPRDLTGSEYAQDLKACEQHTNLARQLLRFLSPGDVLRAIERPGPVTDEVLTTRRGLDVRCWTVAGELPAFPLLQQAGEDAPVRLQVHIARDSGRLLAVDAWPLIDGQPAMERSERILLLDFEQRDDLLVPRRLEHLFRDQSGQLRLKSRAVLTTLTLRPELRPADFDRKRAASRN